MGQKFLRFFVAVIICGAFTASPTRAVPAENAPNTDGRFSLFLQGEYGIGFESVNVGTTTAGDKVSIRAGGGGGGELGIGYGLSRGYDLDITFGFQESVISPAVSNADGSFTRTHALATIKRKFPASGSGQFKAGLGMGVYSSAKLDINTTDAGGARSIVRYDDAIGVHATGEFERFFAKNTSVHLGGRLYFVKYKARSAEIGGLGVPVDSLSSDVKELNGSGIDIIVGISQYF